MKFFYKVLLMIAVVGTLYSCQKDGDETSSTPKEVKISYSFTNTEDFFELMNVSVEYFDDKGSLKKISIDEDWSYNATVPYSSAPAEYKCVVTYSSAVTGLEQPKEKYTFQADFSAQVKTIMQDGQSKNIGSTRITDNSPKTWTAENINEYLTLHTKELSYEFESSLKK